MDNVLKIPTERGTALSWQWTLWAPRILQTALFRNPMARQGAN